MKEIVGARIGTIITNDRSAIADAVERGTLTEFLDRPRMAFMAALDLGIRWEQMAKGPTLFCLDKDNHVHPPNAFVSMQNKSCA